ncbi:L-asparaginase/beta-aspartyl-peptidase (threonine type) [Duganella sp. CF517]|uniref:isoaspartyl peptidase/L-asparaginase n=1 Tax=Duganella sp. CF517 TaxID=1881038 RepID=UPI0008CA86A1|nr:isoaspartyl peptidase/L-asparaginase [Duganella sp. CF517]SEO04528.1 L-asparaginase/beta-aspartyl-peptidase (threonine type) [Duganella sp. CF517]
MTAADSYPPSSPQAPVVVAHGGAGADSQHKDGCAAAAEAGLARLRGGADAVQAAVAAVGVLEDDPRFNAGTGSVLRMDGVTIEMDAAVMDSQGRLGAVAGLRRVRHPVEVAAAVADTPHWLLCGEGALRFARHIGAADHDPTTAQALHKHAAMLKDLQQGKRLIPGEDNASFAQYWNFATPLAVAPGQACDTVGAVVRDAAGRFAVAGSTGGCAPALLGRVGDTPIIGAGFYAGPAGAVAVTGIGEHIVRHLLAHTVHGWLAGGMRLPQALQRALTLFDPAIDIGLIAVSATESGARSNRDMPWAAAGDAQLP